MWKDDDDRRDRRHRRRDGSDEGRRNRNSDRHGRGRPNEGLDRGRDDRYAEPDRRVRRSRFSDKPDGGSRFSNDPDGKRNKWSNATDAKAPGGGNPEDLIRRTNPALSFNNPIGSASGGSSQVRYKLYLPQDGVNYIGLLIGPRGMFQKKLEGESGCKILIRGKGSQKEGQPPQPDDDDDQHVLIMGDTQDDVDRAIEACNKLIHADEETRNMIRKEQLKVAAEINNTVYSTDNKNPVDESMLTPYGPPSPYAYIVPVPNDCIGLIIGKRGETIRRLQQDSGAKIQVAKKEREETKERYVFVEGTEDKYNHAKQLIDEIVDEWKKIHCKPDIPLESKPVGGPHSQTIPIPNNIIGLLTGDHNLRTDPNHEEIIPLIYNKYNVKVYIPDTTDGSGNRNIEVGGDSKESVVRALDEMFRFLREKAPGTNLMMNPLYYAEMTGLSKMYEFSYPGEGQPQAQQYQPSSPTYPPQHTPNYPSPYPPQRHPSQGPEYGYQGPYPHQPYQQPYQPHPSQIKPQEMPAPPVKEGEKHPLAHQYAEHYSKTLGKDYQYYYDYYMKTYAGQPK